MAKPEWGTKRTCQACGARFYDFGRSPITCPACGAVFDLETASRARRTRALPRAADEEAEGVAPEEADLLEEEPEVEEEEEETLEEPEEEEEAAEEVDLEEEEEEPLLEETDEEEDENVLIEDTSDLGDDEDVGDVIDGDLDEGERDR